MSPRPTLSTAGASAAQQAWNEGKVGSPKGRAAVPLTACCPVEGCGAPVPPPPATEHGWAYTRVAGSADPGRWWCSGSCATTGIARAELRMESPWPSSWS